MIITIISVIIAKELCQQIINKQIFIESLMSPKSPNETSEKNFFQT